MNFSSERLTLPCCTGGDVTNLINSIVGKSSISDDPDPPTKQVMVRDTTSTSTTTAAKESLNLAAFAKYIPLRLSAEERSLLTVLQQTLHVSEYTDHVDVTSSRRGVKTRRILDGILEACHIATGLAVASGHERDLAGTCGGTATTENSSTFSFRRKKKNGKKQRKKDAAAADGSNSNDNRSSSSWASRDPKENSALFQTMFEIGRRNKVLNPSQMRTTYGKLMYMLQDAQNPTVAKSLGFSLHKDLVLCGSFLEERACLELLQDDRLEGATRFVRDRDEGTGQRLDRALVQENVAEKHSLANELVKDYASTTIPEDDIRRVIDSISDAIAYVESNVAPVQRMLSYLEDNFDPNQVKDGPSLELRGSSRSASFSSYNRYGLSAYGTSGSSGPTLSHSHSTQYIFVWQSLRLWSKVTRNMHRLWVSADEDLLSTSTSYHLFNTGQGLNRVQACPRVGKVMRNLLNATQQEAGSAWVGLSVVHLGDRDVPNALVFIDKYTQIPRFLNPIVSFLHGLPDLCKDSRIQDYINEHFGSQEKLKLAVLADYFKHGFDGSGDDGGSCIDGRLTSSWNWTSRVAKKPYYHAFMMSGFQGFDGDFK
jgi:hypothetical protein